MLKIIHLIKDNLNSLKKYITLKERGIVESSI